LCAAEVHDAVERDLPVLLPAGVVEYHGPHLPIGTDFMIARSVVERVAERCEIVRAPGIPFGPTGSWAGGPEDGEVDMPCEPFFQYAKAVFRGLVDMGFDRVYAIQHHQGADGGQHLCLERAGYELWAEAGRELDPGWGHAPQRDPDAAGQVHQMRPEVGGMGTHVDDEDGPIPIGHGSMGETQLILAHYPETVDMDALPPEPERPRWLKNSDDATAEDGDHWLDVAVDGWVDALTDD
jgi:creatinine amidohydrolase